MSVTPVEYTRRPFVVKAVQVSAENLTELASWCGGAVEGEGAGQFIRVPVGHPMNDRQTQAFPGDWLLKAGRSFKSYTDKAFTASFAVSDPEALLGAEEGATVVTPRLCTCSRKAS